MVKIIITHPIVVGALEIESRNGLILASASFNLSAPTNSYDCEKEYFWFSVTEMECDLRELLWIFMKKDVEIEWQVMTPEYAECSDELKTDEQISELLSLILGRQGTNYQNGFLV